MPSNRSSARSSPLPPSSPARSLMVYRVAIDLYQKGLEQELHKRFPALERVTAFEYQSNNENDKDLFVNLRLDFKSDAVVRELLEKNFFLLNNKRHTIRLTRPLICHRCEQEGHRATECPQKPITEQRLRELCDEQQRHIEETLAAFDKKWTDRLATVQNASATTTKNDQVMGIFKDLSSVAQQFNQQNNQMQKQLGSLLMQMQQLQIKSNGATTTINGH